MKIKTTWDDETKKIIRYEFLRDWNWQDFHNAIEQARLMLDEVDHKVGIIFDFRNASLIPNGAITQIKKAYSNPKHPNIGTNVVIGGSAFMQAIMSIGAKLTGLAAQNWDFQYAASLEEARQIIYSKAENAANQ